MNLIKRLFSRQSKPARRRNPFLAMSIEERLTACLQLGRYDAMIFEGW